MGKRAKPGPLVEDDFAVLQQMPKRPPRDQSSSALPAGPQSLADIMDWPSSLVTTTLAHVGTSGVDRLRNLLKHGVLNTTDYSGIDGPREVAHQLAPVLGRALNMKVCMPFVRSCDNDKVPQRVLKWAAEHLDSNHTCVFADILDAMDPDAREFIAAMEPPASVRRSKHNDEREAAVNAYTNLAAWLLEHREVAYPADDLTSKCLVHGKRCPLHAKHTHESSLFIGDVMERPLRVNWAGTICRGWSQVGLQGRHLDPSEKIHAAWLTQRIRLAELGLEDAFFSECTKTYPARVKLEQPLKGRHHVVYTICGPETLGLPTRRTRVLTFALVRDRLAQGLRWVASIS